MHKRDGCKHNHQDCPWNLLYHTVKYTTSSHNLLSMDGQPMFPPIRLPVEVHSGALCVTWASHFSTALHADAQNKMAKRGNKSVKSRRKMDLISNPPVPSPFLNPKSQNLAGGPLLPPSFHPRPPLGPPLLRGRADPQQLCRQMAQKEGAEGGDGERAL